MTAIAAVARVAHFRLVQLYASNRYVGEIQISYFSVASYIVEPASRQAHGCFVLLKVKICMACANDLETERTRQGAKSPSLERKDEKILPMILTCNLRPLRLCGRYSEI
jgi:hypothetical protein